VWWCGPEERKRWHTLHVIVDPGDRQGVGTAVLRGADHLDPRLHAAMVDALPDRVFHGKVVRIVPQGDIQKNTVQCKVEIEAPDAALRPDMLARVRIEASGAAATAAKGEALAVPADALRSRTDDAGELIVAMPDAGAARTELRRVTLGSDRANGWIEVVDGLNAGDRVVLDGAVGAGSRIRPIEVPKSEPATGDAP
jgi:multidrug efflux pump subunit AcrA (membrane-fusion protein)